MGLKRLTRIQYFDNAPPHFGLVKRLYHWVRMLLLPNRYKFISVGRGFYMGSGGLVQRNSIKIGHYSFIGNDCHLASKVDIGNFVMLASQVSIVGGDHEFGKVCTPMIWAGPGNNRKVVIDDDVWIGHGTIILHGVSIGEGSVIAAGSIVTKDIPPYSVNCGIPAKFARWRFPEEEIKKHKKSLDQFRKKYCNQ